MKDMVTKTRTFCFESRSIRGSYVKELSVFLFMIFLWKSRVQTLLSLSFALLLTQHTIRSITDDSTTHTTGITGNNNGVDRVADEIHQAK